jgi:hypothetical protein
MEKSQDILELNGLSDIFNKVKAYRDQAYLTHCHVGVVFNWPQKFPENARQVGAYLLQLQSGKR